jgi:hypothetical protein
MPEQPTTLFTSADVEAARQRLNDNRYGGPDDVHDLDREDITEIIQIVLTATWMRAYERGLREATEGLTREVEYAIRWDREDNGTTWYSEPYYRRDLAETHRDGPEIVVQRTILAGPWEPADQPDPTVNAELTDAADREEDRHA